MRVWTYPAAPGIRTGGIWTAERWGVTAPAICGWKEWMFPTMRNGGMALADVPCGAAPE
jgi:hypothetical protein